jgi:hypothetical protein
MRTEERLAAMEAAANVLELARSRPWADLTPTWAASQQAPDGLVARLLDPALTVTVAAEKDRPRVKRVTVEVNWTDGKGKGAPPVTLVGLYADRSAGGGS